MDIIDTLSESQIEDLMAFAEGTLPAARQPAVAAWIDDSEDLRELVRRQRLSLAAAQGPAAEPVPASLHAAFAAARPLTSRRRRLTLMFSAAAVLAAVLIAFVVFSGGTSPAGPTVADVAQVALLPATAAAPAPVAGTGHLSMAVQGLAFPDYSGPYGWQAVGTRRDSVARRDVTVVYYADGGRQVGYAIVSTPVLASPSQASATVKDGVQYLSYGAQGKTIVTWQRDGHTCVLVGNLPARELLTLASWSGGPAGTS